LKFIPLAVRASRRLTVPVILLVLSGCPTNPPVVEPLTASEIAAREARLVAFTSWRALGSLSVDSAEQGSINASFAWDSRPQEFDIKLFGPLGVQTVRLIENQSGARLLSRNNPEANGPSAQTLLLEALGVQIPLRSMQRWVVGLQGTADDVQRDVAGRITQMVVEDEDRRRWDVVYNRYMKVDNLDLPKSIDVSGNGLAIKLELRKWIKLDVRPENRLQIPATTASVTPATIAR